MFDQDAFSQWLGIEIIEVKDGYCKLKMTVRKEMLNGFHITHGGISYSLADTALAFASNTHGKKCISVETSISEIRKCAFSVAIFCTDFTRSIISNCEL